MSFIDCRNEQTRIARMRYNLNLPCHDNPAEPMPPPLSDDTARPAALVSPTKRSSLLAMHRCLETGSLSSL